MKFFLFLLVFLSPPAFSKETLIDESYAFIADNLFLVGTSIDNFFANNTLETNKNDSQIRISSKTRISEHEKMITYGDFRFQLSLPKTEKRFQLVLERERVNENDDEDNNNIGRRKNQEKSTSAALQFILEESQMWSLKTNVGAKFNLPPLLFARAQARRSFYIDNFHIYPNIKILWEDQIGWTHTGDLNLDVALDRKFTFRWIDQWIWNDQDYIITQSHGPSLYQKISEKKAISYNARATGSNDPKEAVNYYTFNIRYRELIYAYWLFLELSPQVEFIREDRFRKDLSLEAKLEIVVFKND